MDDVVRSSIPPPLPPKTRKGARPVQQQVHTTATVNGGGASKSPLLSFSLPEMRSANLVAASQRHIASSQSSNGDHVVKIRISPGDGDRDYSATPSDGCIRISVGTAHDNDHEEMVRRGNSVADTFIKVTPERSSFFYYSNSYACQSNGMVISSGQSSPSDTLDSGTCSDLDGSTPPPLPKKNSIASASSSATVTVTVNGNHHHRRTGSLTSSGAEVDSDDDAGSNISCDSLNGHELNGVAGGGHEEQIPNGNVHKTTFKKVLSANQNVGHEKIRAKTPPPPPMKNIPKPSAATTGNGFLPQGLLQDIRDRSAKLTIVPANNAAVKKTQSWREEGVTNKELQRPNSTTPEPKEPYQKQQSSLYRLHSFSTPPTIEEAPAKKGNNIVEERTYEERKQEEVRRSQTTTPEPQPYSRSSSYTYEADRFYKFHLREHELDEEPEQKLDVDPGEDETFAGLKDLLRDKDASSTIRSAKGTVRGVKNRVRAGIATFLQFPDTKSYKEKEAGKVVLYTTTMGIVRETFQECLKIKKILRTLLVKYEERDVFMSREVQAEIRERMHCDAILVPQLFLEGQHVGDAETIERLNETGELRKMLKPFRSPDACNTCPVCGGFRLLPCSVCNGSKKSVHRNDFTAEFVALKCMNCDEVGLVRCYAC